MLELLTARYTFLDERLARHYGIDGVAGSYFRHVELREDSPRGGLLGLGSILTATSVANRTSPVVRGAWIVENLLGAEVPPPPPGVEADLSGARSPAEAKTLRQRMEAHRTDPVCASCHQLIDPFGFALENFDLVGRWRDSDAGEPIDASARLVDGTAVDGPAALRAALLDRSDAVVTSFTERLLTYALGRILEAHDKPAVRESSPTQPPKRSFLELRTGRREQPAVSHADEARGNYGGTMSQAPHLSPNVAPNVVGCDCRRPPMTSSGSGCRISFGSFSWIRMMLPGSPALAGGLMVGCP